MTERDKITKIGHAILKLGHSASDAKLIAETGLTVKDLDQFYKIAEILIDKAITKPETRPTTLEDKIREFNSWVKFRYDPTYQRRLS